MLSPKLRHRSSIFSLIINRLITLTILLPSSPFTGSILRNRRYIWCSRLVELALFNRTRKKKNENKLDIRTSKNWLELKTEVTACYLRKTRSNRSSLLSTLTFFSSIVEAKLRSISVFLLNTPAQRINKFPSNILNINDSYATYVRHKNNANRK